MMMMMMVMVMVSWWKSQGEKSKAEMTMALIPQAGTQKCLET